MILNQVDDALPSARQELLDLAVARASGDPLRLSIRQLLRYWDAKREVT